MKKPTVLAINPYIYDFAAYSFWSSPLGLLYMAAILRRNGFQVGLIDCMSVREDKRRPDGRAPFIKEKVAKPDALKGLGKNMRRYGMSPQRLKEEMARFERPDLVIVTSIMTYWYTGAKEVIGVVKEMYPRSRIVVGGIYPTLCYEEALRSFAAADLVVRSGELDIFYRFIEDTLGVKLVFKPLMDDLDILPYPAYDLYEDIPFVPLLTSLGCAFKCTYCATPYMYPKITRRSAAAVTTEVSHWHERGVRRFVIYDDSFLYNSNAYAKPLLSGISRLPFKVDIYNPNAVNAAFIDDDLSGLLALSGFREVRIGLETVNPVAQRDTGGKVTNRIFERAVAALKRAGYRKEQMSAYILAGLPGQHWEEVRQAIDYLKALGVIPYIAEYTPIPHTPMFEKFKDAARFPVAEDAIYQNNALFPYAWEGFTEEDLNFLKRYAKE